MEPIEPEILRDWRDSEVEECEDDYPGVRHEEALAGSGSMADGRQSNNHVRLTTENRLTDSIVLLREKETKKLENGEKRNKKEKNEKKNYKTKK